VTNLMYMYLVAHETRNAVLTFNKIIDDFHLIWNGVCRFLLAINSNLGRISHRFRDIASFPLKTHILPPSSTHSIRPSLLRWSTAAYFTSLITCLCRS